MYTYIYIYIERERELGPARRACLVSAAPSGTRKLLVSEFRYCQATAAWDGSKFQREFGIP